MSRDMVAGPFVLLYQHHKILAQEMPKPTRLGLISR